MEPLAPEPRRPRPVAGLPAVDAHVVAKAWLLELIAGATLQDAAALPVARLAQEGPRLAAGVLAALSDDAALGRLGQGGDLAGLSASASGLSGAAGAPAAVRAVEALRRATLAAILAAARLDAATTAELADRLAHVCATVAEAAAEPAGPPTPRREPLREALRRAAGPPSPETDDPRGAPVTAPEAEVVALRGEADALHEQRADPGAVGSAVQRRLERHAHDGSPFALLAVEADGLERLRAAQQEGEVDAALEALERALAAELRPADQLLREEPGRYWVTAPDTGPAVGRLLAERLADAAGAAASHRGAPLTVSIGVAACPDDGDDADPLMAAADRAMFEARAAGTRVV